VVAAQETSFWGSYSWQLFDGEVLEVLVPSSCDLEGVELEEVWHEVIGQVMDWGRGSHRLEVAPMVVADNLVMVANDSSWASATG